MQLSSTSEIGRRIFLRSLLAGSGLIATSMFLNACSPPEHDGYPARQLPTPAPDEPRVIVELQKLTLQGSQPCNVVLLGYQMTDGPGEVPQALRFPAQDTGRSYVKFDATNSTQTIFRPWGGVPVSRAERTTLIITAIAVPSNTAVFWIDQAANLLGTAVAVAAPLLRTPVIAALVEQFAPTVIGYVTQSIKDGEVLGAYRYMFHADGTVSEEFIAVPGKGQLFTLTARTFVTTAQHAPVRQVNANLFDLTAAAAQAHWIGEVRAQDPVALTFPGLPSSWRDGFAMFWSNARLEDGSTPQLVLATHPRIGDRGSVTGVYAPLAIQHGDRFISDIGFLERENTRASCRWEFGVIDGRQLLVLARQDKAYDGTLAQLNVDLSPLAGKTLPLVLRVSRNKNSKDFETVWINPRIERR